MLFELKVVVVTLPDSHSIADGVKLMVRVPLLYDSEFRIVTGPIGPVSVLV